MHARPRARVRAAVIVSLVSLSAALFAMTAHPQGVAATAKATPVPPTSDVNTLRRRVDELERRILELEKQKADEVELAEEEDALEKKLEQRLDAADKRLEQRLASIESAQDEQKAQQDAPPASSTTKVPGPQTFVAPFTVVDGSGKVLMRVDRSPKGNPRLTVGTSRGGSVQLVASTTGGLMQLMDDTGTVRVSTFGDYGSGNYPGMTIRTTQGYAFLGGNKDGLPVVQIANLANKPIVELRGLESQSGLLMISHEGGDALVMAGETKTGVGMVQTGPGGNGPAATLGNAGKAASEIIGKK